MARSSVVPFVGRRSGVTLANLPRPGENENQNLQEVDVNSVFAAAAAAAAAAASTSTERINSSNGSQTKSNQRPLRDMRFSLEGQQDNSPENEKVIIAKQQQSSMNAVSSNMIRKIKNFSGTIAESDLSPVSTASPLVQKQDTNQISNSHEVVEEEEDEIEDNQESLGDEGEMQKNEAKTPLAVEPDRATPLQLSTPRHDSTQESTSPSQSPKFDFQTQISDREEDHRPMIPSNDDVGSDHDEMDVLPDAAAPDDDLIPPSPPDSPDDGDGGIGIVNTPESVSENKSPSPKIASKPAQDDKPPASKSEDEDDEHEGDVEEPTPRQQKEPKKKPKHNSIKNDLKKIKPKSAIRTKKKKTEVGRRKRGSSDDDDGDNSDQRSAVIKAPPTKKRNVSRFTTTFSPKGIPLPREFETVLVSDLKTTPLPGVRRSRRARCSPLQFWKNERAEYGPPDEDETISSELFNMPVVKAYVRSKDTPYKPRKAPQVSRFQPKKNPKTDKTNDSTVPDSERKEVRFDSAKLKKKYVFSEGDEAVLWDDGVEESRDQKVISYVDKMEARKLPMSKNRLKSDGKVVGKAAQAFNVPNGPKALYVGYITGNLTLPPRGIKDAESVGACSQVFTVVRCQPGAMEVAYSDPEDDNEDSSFNPDTAQRFLLNPGDLFRVPPGNSYRLCNHSKTTDVFLTWTIIRPANLSALQESPSRAIATPN